MLCRCLCAQISYLFARMWSFFLVLKWPRIRHQSPKPVIPLISGKNFNFLGPSSLPTRELDQITWKSPSFSTVFMTLLSEGSLKFTDSKEFEEMLAYTKALRLEEEGLVMKSKSVYLPRAERKSQYEKIGRDIEPFTYIEFNSWPKVSGAKGGVFNLKGNWKHYRFLRRMVCLK